MAIYLTQEPEQYGLAFNDNTYVIKTTNYTPTVRLKIDILPEAYPTEPKIGTTSGSAFFYDPTNHKEYRLKITEEDKDCTRSLPKRRHCFH
jgi:hypothetical protein